MLEILMASENLTETVHTYNALIYAADVCGEYEKVVSLYESVLGNLGLKSDFCEGFICECR